MSNNPMGKTGRWFGGVGLLLLVVLMAWLGRALSPGINWIAEMCLMIVFVVVLGIVIVKRPMGILINERKLMSLSRFQMVVWTIIILSAYITMVLVRIKEGIADPLAIQMDWQVYALMGISTTSLVGTPLINSTKTTKDPADEVAQKTADAVPGESVDAVKNNSEGILYGNADVKDARLTDMFEGDELNNTWLIDLSKVQMFFFTLVAALSYGILLFNTIKNKGPDGLGSFPKISEGMLAILGISHGGYLASKGTDHTPTK